MIIEQIIYKHAVETPEKTAVIVGAETVSYAKLWTKICQAASYFEKQDLAEGSRIILSANKEIKFLYSYFGAHMAGLVCVPIDSDTNIVRFQRIMDCSDPVVIVGSLKNRGEYQVIDFDEVTSEISSERKFPSEEQIADLLFTTGTTGFPKGIGLSFKNQWVAANQINTFVGNTAEDIELLALPISHSFGLGRIRCVLQKGGTLVFVPGFASMKKFFGELERCKCTGFGMVPASWAYISKMSGDRIGQFSSQLKYIEIGSAAMPIIEKKRLMSLLPTTRISMHYGLTEASRSTFISFHDNKNKLNTVGRSSPGVDIKIFDENGQIVENGIEGEICVKGDNVCSCYWCQSKEDFAKDFYNDYFRTGDYGSIDADGFISLKSRIKELINVGGKKVSPIEVEEVLNKLEGIEESACIGVYDPVYGEVVKAFVVGTLTPSDNERIKKFVMSLVESYKVPVYIEHILEIPKTHNGKIQRLLLQNM